MAVYAAVTSLMGTVHLISQSSLGFQESNKECSKSLYEKVGSLLEFLDNSDNELMKDLQKKVKDLANEVEDEVESQVVRIMEKDKHIQKEANERLRKILEQAIEDIDSVKEELSKQRNKNNNLVAGNCSLGGPTSPRSHVSTLENDMVGHSDEQARVRGELTGPSSQLEVISIAGMGGIGKSTFAKKMFSDPSIVGFFDVRGWITVSKDYSLRKMLISLLQSATGMKVEINPQDQGNEEEEIINADIADRLKKSLKRRRYLIVVDDIWSTKAWDDIRQWLPENNNRSRILLTTRIMEVARYASYPKNPFPMRVLHPEESWNLFCQKAFGKNDCPAKFEKVGKVIVGNCNGLPLMISVVAGSLSSKRTLDEWNKVDQSVTSLVNLDDYQRCSGVLALSYNHLPSHLKACFLYFGVLKKSSEISVENLIRLWMAEGLCKLKGIGELEKEASSLLHDLIDKSLIVACKHSLDGKIKTCKIHDLLHDLCLRELESESLLYVSNPQISGTNVLQLGRWVSFHRQPVEDFFSLPFPTYAKTRSLHFLAVKPYRSEFELRPDSFKLLRVLDLLGSGVRYLPNGLSNLVSLRYLRAGFISGYLPIYKLQNLQFLSFRHVPKHVSVDHHLPDGTWKMSQLRHIDSAFFCLCSPPKVSGNKYRVLENLQSVHGLRPDCCTKEMFEGIKKVRKLGICGLDSHFNDAPKCLDNLRYLPELEALKIVTYNHYRWDFLHRLPVPCVGSFPPNLKKLTIQGTHLLWSKLTIISKLPKLEVLQLKKLMLFGDELGETAWEVSEMGFRNLKFLLIERMDLKCWKATDDSFPCLERVIIKNCPSLQDIPKEFAESMALKRIELWGCTPSLVHFAKEIQEEQEILGNNILQVYAYDTIREVYTCPTEEDAKEEVYTCPTEEDAKEEVYTCPTEEDAKEEVYICPIDSVKEELSKQRNKNNNLVAGNCSLGGPTSPRSHVSTLENDMVGHSDEQARVRGELTGPSSQLEVISIAGMGGIGKSTFAKKMFSDPSIVGFFDVRGWITVSKDYSLRKMLISLLQSATGMKVEINPQDQGNEEEEEIINAELADRLKKSLRGRRYLIVVDDIWSTKAWDDIRQWLPENNNRSRILLTTRIMEVARYASYPKNPFPMRFLDPEESWNLFCQKTFGKNDCPAEFEKVGKVIVGNCNGLPLMISVTARSLSSEKMLCKWHEVDQSVTSLVNLDHREEGS